MEIIAIVTLLLLFQYLIFMMICGMARSKGHVPAPAVAGDETFERALRVQMNTVEQLMITLPALWISGFYFSAHIAAGLGLVFFIGRILYRAGYMRDPKKRGAGMMVGLLANVGLLLTALWGVIGEL